MEDRGATTGWERPAASWDPAKIPGTAQRSLRLPCSPTPGPCPPQSQHAFLQLLLQAQSPSPESTKETLLPSDCLAPSCLLLFGGKRTSESHCREGKPFLPSPAPLLS